MKRIIEIGRKRPLTIRAKEDQMVVITPDTPIFVDERPVRDWYMQTMNFGDEIEITTMSVNTLITIEEIPNG